MSFVIDIEHEHEQIIRDILRRHLPTGVRVWVFGSRANGTAEKYSDVDIALEGDTEIKHDVMIDLDIAFEESTLPFTVDIVDLRPADDQFKKIINTHKIALYLNQ